MNYDRLYRSIVENARKNLAERTGIYTEKHHIVPRSLGGKNTKDNLVRLTAREHFVCHWLLVKMQKRGTIERSKMLHAFWMMKPSPVAESPRYMNSRVYEKYKEEYSSDCRAKQTGSGNSNFGKSWYTNINTGETKVFSTVPGEKWILGRNVLDGQTCSVKGIVLKHKESLLAKERWDRFHSGNWKSLSDFDTSEGRSRMASVQMFKTQIPLYLSYSKTKRRRFVSDKSLIGVYE